MVYKILDGLPRPRCKTLVCVNKEVTLCTYKCNSIYFSYLQE